MGVVYKAEDTKLERTVALKFLAAHLLADEESRKRFEREAKAAAALSHPNICTIHEIDEAEGKTFLALEFVEGESLEKKIDRGPVALKEALDIGRQVAGGLSAAHDKKIVHRDIKPGNLLITPDGRVKILDFGLALLTEGSKITQLDTTLGTVAYMSPQQAQGVKVDHRADVWALGCVLYEMVCGQRPFRGEYDQALLYEIVHEEPQPLTGLRTGVPVELEFMVGKCLAKDAEQRYQNTADMIVDLGNLAEKLKSGRSAILRTAGGLGDTIATGTSAGRSPRSGDEQAEQHGDGQGESLSPPRGFDVASILSAVVVPGLKRRLPWALFAVTAIALLAVSLFHFRETPAEAPLRRFAFTPESLRETIGGRAAISPNGRQIVYVAGGEESKLWVRDLDAEEPRELAGTEGAQRPFWSPDSEFIGFAANRELKKISAQGGPTITLCQLPGGILQGGGWSPGGDSIAFGSGGPSRIYEVTARGGEPRLLFESEQGDGSTGPHFLPVQAVARSIIFDLGSPTDRDIAVKNLETGEWEVLAEGAYPVYSPSRHILYQTNRYESGLWALPFSIETLKPTGEAFPIAENAGGPSVGADGTLVYTDFWGREAQQLAWRDRSGKKLRVIGQPQEFIRYPDLSPDGGRVAVRGFEDGNDDIWVHELERPLKRRLTFHAAVDSQPIWSPSGEKITFRSRRQGDDIYSRPADGTGEIELLAGADLPEYSCDWSPDGKYLLYRVNDPKNLRDLWYLKRKEDGSDFDSLPFVQTSFNESEAKFSPRGHFVAFVSDQSGQDQVYVRTFPEGERQSQVSTRGGGQPRWSRDGKELFYVVDDTLMAVEVSTRPSFTTAATTRLFQDASLRSTTGHRYDVSPDGRRFVLVETIESEEAKAPSIHVVQNWFAEFRDRRD